MDDNELGTLLDATVRDAAPSDATLTRIHGRAAQRVRRARFATAALVAVILVAGGATAAALAGSANRSGPVAPAASTVFIPVAGAPCPPGSLTLDIERPSPWGAGRVTVIAWVVTVTGHTNLVCRSHAGLESTLEKPDGTVISAIPRKPATQPGRYEDLFVPGRREAVAHVVWQIPCRDTPVRIVVGFDDHTAARAAQIKIPRLNCAQRDSDFPATGFFDPIVPGPATGSTKPSPTTTAATP